MGIRAGETLTVAPITLEVNSAIAPAELKWEPEIGEL